MSDHNFNHVPGKRAVFHKTGSACQFGVSPVNYSDSDWQPENSGSNRGQLNPKTLSYIAVLIAICTHRPNLDYIVTAKICIYFSLALRPNAYSTNRCKSTKKVPKIYEFY